MKILTSGLRILFAGACLIVIIGGLRFASSFLVPVVLAFFLAALNMPFMDWLRRRGLPHALGMIVTLVVNLAALSVFVGLTVNAMMDFLPKAPFYVEEMRSGIENWGKKVFETPILTNTDQWQASKENFFEMIRRLTRQFTYELPTANQVLDNIASLTGTVFFVFLIMIFMMNESLVMGSRFEDIRGSDGPDLAFLGQISLDIQRYLHIKTAVSLATGLLAALLTWSFNLEFPLLWGLLAFLLNYIPSIGSIIAAIPPCLLSLWQLGMVPTLLIAAGYLSINMSLGNFIEPMLLGKRFGISILVVILSALFWGWMWGPVGMFVSIPLTMLIKVILDNTAEFRWISAAMGKSGEEMPEIDGWTKESLGAYDESSLGVEDSDRRERIEL